MTVLRRRKFCECGCGNVLRNPKARFKRGHNRLGFKCSEETKRKNRKANLGKVLSEEHKKKIGAGAVITRSKDSEETKRKRAIGISIALTGRNLSEEHKKKIGTTMKSKSYKRSLKTISKWKAKVIGRKNSKESIDRMRLAHLGAVVSIETRRKNSLARGGTGELTSTKGSYTRFTESLREFIRDRGGRECQLCFIPEEKIKEKFSMRLDVHHIDYDKKNYNPENLIALCHSCHTKTTCNRDKWITLFQSPQRLTLIMGNKG